MKGKDLKLIWEGGWNNEGEFTEIQSAKIARIGKRRRKWRERIFNSLN